MPLKKPGPLNLTAYEPTRGHAHSGSLSSFAWLSEPETPARRLSFGASSDFLLGQQRTPSPTLMRGATPGLSSPWDKFHFSHQELGASASASACLPQPRSPRTPTSWARRASYNDALEAMEQGTPVQSPYDDLSSPWPADSEAYASPLGAKYAHAAAATPCMAPAAFVGRNTPMWTAQIHHLAWSRPRPGLAVGWPTAELRMPLRELAGAINALELPCYACVVDGSALRIHQPETFEAWLLDWEPVPLGGRADVASAYNSPSPIPTSTSNATPNVAIDARAQAQTPPPVRRRRPTKSSPKTPERGQSRGPSRAGKHPSPSQGSARGRMRSESGPGTPPNRAPMRVQLTTPSGTTWARVDSPTTAPSPPRTAPVPPMPKFQAGQKTTAGLQAGQTAMVALQARQRTPMMLPAGRRMPVAIQARPAVLPAYAEHRQDAWYRPPVSLLPAPLPRHPRYEERSALFALRWYVVSDGRAFALLPEPGHAAEAVDRALLQAWCDCTFQVQRMQLPDGNRAVVIHSLGPLLPWFAEVGLTGLDIQGMATQKLDGLLAAAAAAA